MITLKKRPNNYHKVQVKVENKLVLEINYRKRDYYVKFFMQLRI